MLYEFKFPDVGEGVHEGKILQFMVKPGDKVTEGDILATVETDKVVAEIPTSKTGILSKFGFNEGDVIEVGQTLAFIELEGSAPSEDAKSASKPESEAEPISEGGSNSVVGSMDTTSIEIPSTNEASSSNSSVNTGSDRVLATPLAKRVARENGIDLSTITGTGPAGRVTKDDVLGSSGSSTSSAPVSTSSQQIAPVFQDDGKAIVPLTNMRKTIAKNMTISGNTPTATFHDLVVVDKVVALRKEINETSEVRVSFQPIFMKALAVALKKFPQMNSTYDPQKQEVTTYNNANIGIAMETPKGLMVPSVKGCEQLTISEINIEMKALVEKAMSGKIGMSDLKGGSFSITNYGSFGGIYGNPLINPPQVAIMGFGRMHDSPVAVNGELKICKVLPISYCFDHRIIDGAPGAQFLTYFKDLLENPNKLLMEMR